MALAILLLGCHVDKPDEDTACERTEEQPLPVSEVTVEVPCGGQLKQIAVGPDDGDDYIAFDEDGSCPELSDEPGFVHILDGSSLSVTTLSAPETNGQNGEIELGRSGPDTLLALPRTNDNGREWADVEFYDAATGSLVGTLDGGRSIAVGIEFADENLLTDEPWYQDTLGRVYVFSPPFTGTFGRDDAVAIHDSPIADCVGCLFGSVLVGLGDVTGDGVADALMGGGGLWFVEGELLTVDQGVSSAIAVSASAASIDTASAPVGDLDGDGLGDYATGARTNTYGPFGAVYLLRGGETEPFVEVYGSPDRPDEQIADSITGLGDLDGDGTATMAVIGEYGQGMGGEAAPNVGWLVSGPLRCGEHDITDVGTLLDPEDGMASGRFEGGERLLVAPTGDIDSDDAFLRVWRW